MMRVILGVLLLCSLVLRTAGEGEVSAQAFTPNEFRALYELMVQYKYGRAENCPLVIKYDAEPIEDGQDLLIRHRDMKIGNNGLENCTDVGEQRVTIPESLSGQRLVNFSNGINNNLDKRTVFEGLMRELDGRKWYVSTQDSSRTCGPNDRRWFHRSETFFYFDESETIRLTVVAKVTGGEPKFLSLPLVGNIRYMIAVTSGTSCIYRVQTDVANVILGTARPSDSPSVSPIPSDSAQPSPSASASASVPVPSSTPSASSIAIESSSPSTSATPSMSVSQTSSPVASPSVSSNSSPSVTASSTPSVSISTTVSATPSSSASSSASAIATTSSASPSASVSSATSASVSSTPSLSMSSTPQPTQSSSPSVSVTSTPSASMISTPSASMASSPSVSMASTPSASMSSIPPAGMSPTPSASMSSSSSPTKSSSPTASSSSTPSTEASTTPTQSSSPRPSPTSSPTPTNSPSSTPTRIPTRSPEPSLTATQSLFPTRTPTPSSTPSTTASSLIPPAASSSSAASSSPTASSSASSSSLPSSSPLAPSSSTTSSPGASSTSAPPSSSTEPGTTQSTPSASSTSSTTPSSSGEPPLAVPTTVASALATPSSSASISPGRQNANLGSATPSTTSSSQLVPLGSATPSASVSATPIFGIDPGNLGSEDRNTSTIDGTSTCFPGDALVKVQTRGTIKISSLQIGDSVWTGTEYSRVMMFTHRHNTIISPFRRVCTQEGCVRLSHGHFLYANGGLLPAGMLKIGDFVTGGSVLSLDNVVGKGLFNPQTENGDIVVDGFRASCYTKTVDYRTAHALLTPIRAVARLLPRGVEWLGDRVESVADAGFSGFGFGLLAA